MHSLTKLIKSCNVCRHETSCNLKLRTDGLLIEQCEKCGLSVIAPMPEDLSVLCNDSLSRASPSGAASVDGEYKHHEFAAEQGKGWAAALIPLIRENGAVLDVGCADGYLLNKLGPAYERFGIEVNSTMRDRAAAAGITLLGDDLLDQSVIRANMGRFDIVTCVAVFQRLRDFRGGVEAVLRLLKPTGVLIFEVPLIFPGENNRVWQTSSLDQVYYPTESSLRHLMEVELGASLVGAEIPIRGSASTFIGIVPKQSADAARLSELFARVRGAGPAPLNAAERIAKMQLSLVHAANGDNSDVLALADLSPNLVTEPLLNRLAQLWNLDRSHLTAAQMANQRAEAAEAVANSMKDDNQTLHEQLAHERRRVLVHARQLVQERERVSLLAEQLSELAEQLSEIERSYEAMRQSRVYRLQQAYVRLYTVPMVSPLLRRARYALGKVTRAARRR